MYARFPPFSGVRSSISSSGGRARAHFPEQWLVIEPSRHGNHYFPGKRGSVKTLHQEYITVAYSG